MGISTYLNRVNPPCNLTLARSVSEQPRYSTVFRGGPIWPGRKQCEIRGIQASRHGWMGWWVYIETIYKSMGIFMGFLPSIKPSNLFGIIDGLYIYINIPYPMILFGFRPSVWWGRILQPSTVPHVWSIAKMKGNSMRLPEEHVDGKKGPKLIKTFILHSCMRKFVCVILIREGRWKMLLCVLRCRRWYPSSPTARFSQGRPRLILATVDLDVLWPSNNLVSVSICFS